MAKTKFKRHGKKGSIGYAVEKRDVLSTRRGGAVNVVTYTTEMMNAEAKLAGAFVERWGMIVGKPDGEDSAGRQKLKLPEVSEIIGRACDMAGTLMVEIRKRGWTMDLPSLDEAEVILENYQDEQEKKAKKSNRKFL